MAASNRDLESEMKAGRFRADLFFRLAVVSLKLPSLRERREDIPMLVSSYLDHFRISLGRSLTGIDAEAMDALVRYEWPGNVRELINVMEQTCLLSSGPRIGLADLPHRISPVGQKGDALPSLDFDRFLSEPIPKARRELMDAFEYAYLTKVLGETGGRVGKAADRAGVNPRSLHSLMKRHRLRKEAFRG
jgi:DNA-binding NtrC family response regulator